MTLDIGSLQDPSQDLLPVGLTGPGGLYQLVNVCEFCYSDYKFSEWYTVVDCGSRPSIGNGSPGSPTSTTYEGTVTYTCDTGYEVVSTGVTTAMATCMASGTWGPLPTCSRMLL